MTKGLLLRLTGLTIVVGLFTFAYLYEDRGMSQLIDLPAALLVIFVPPLLLLIFNSSLPPVRALWQRVRQLRLVSNEGLHEELEKQSQIARSSTGISRLLAWSSNHPDQMVRYGARIMTSKYQTEELTHLLMQKMSFEDRQWQRAVEDIGFLAKTAPYFGMLATVIGMLHMLRTIEDFSRITASVGLALFGTLYGLILFALVYSPLEKALSTLRQDVRRRNEMCARWFVHIAERRDADFISDDLAAQVRSKRDLSEKAAHV